MRQRGVHAIFIAIYADIYREYIIYCSTIFIFSFSFQGSYLVFVICVSSYYIINYCETPWFSIDLMSHICYICK